ncbi:UbiA prenyltransferase [Thermobaculum terrenum ATCC BAA-798]|uniref:UbiA prenyltransferase n=2 Tax=Thermobaculum TaxID=262406 RepID=D1CDT5_THET1|nr:UbiA prenyltransferase [Thermobaculum terrenum ATCC BAA-798]
MPYQWHNNFVMKQSKIQTTNRYINSALFKHLYTIIVELRPKQWTKNLLVFAGLVFSHNMLSLPALLRSSAAFVIFCAVSSAAYIINDLADVERDRLHPVKRLRPIASGLISEPTAISIASLLLICSLIASFLLSWSFALVTVLYFLIVVLYSFYLKNVVLLDVFSVASGFVLRAVAGTLVINVTLSSWLILCTLLLSLFLALAKRRHELLLLEEKASVHRQILNEYSRVFLDQLMAVVTSSTIIAYSLYTFSAASLPNDRSMMLTIPFVIYAIFRYLYLIYQQNEGGNPETLLLQDKPLLISIVLWGIAVVLILYRPWA